MANSTYISTQISKIINDEGFEFPQNIAMASAWILGNLKGVNLKVYDVRGKSSLADFFVIGSANNTTQANAMAEEIATQLRNQGFETISREGVKKDADWTLLDFGDIIIHIFLDLSRDSYSIDELWDEATPVDIPAEYYYSDEDETEKKESTDEDYF